MNKIIVVGHPHSGYQCVEKLLYNCGMKPALPSQQENISPIEISSILCKAHDVVSFESFDGEEQLLQTPVGTVWNGMVLDLFRGNIDQPLWGWSDPQAIYFLEYWRQIDPQIMFVLVYNHPHTILSHDPNGVQNLSSEILKQRVNKWHIYNAALLHFYHRNKERSILVHTQQVDISSNNCLQQISKRIRSNQSTNTDLLHTYPADNDSEKDLIISQAMASKRSIDNLQCLQSNDNYREKYLRQFLAGELIARHPKAGQLYEDMQAVANLPDEKNADVHNLFGAWRIMSEFSLQFQNLHHQSQERQQQVDILKKSNLILKKQIQKKLAKNKLLHQQLQQLQEESEHIQQENTLLIQQLHLTQEELEYYFLQNQELKKHQQPTYTGALERMKNDLPYQLGAAMIERSRQAWLLPFLPFTLLRLAWQHRKEQQEVSQNLPPLTEYSDYDRAQKAKNHLSYMLGVAWLKYIRTPWGWFYIPIALFNANRAFRSYQKKQGHR